MSTHNTLSRRSLVLGASILIVMVLGLSAVMAQQLVQQDGRINQLAHFGGDALYCMDASDNVTNDSSTFAYFQVLDQNGQQLWTISKEEVELGLGQIDVKPTPYLLGEGMGTYGPVYLFSNAAQDGTPYFIFIGFDEWGKTNTLVFYGCTPEVSPQAPTPTFVPTLIT